MAIKWRSVKITNNKSGKIHLGFQARKFIRENCPDAISDIEIKSLADTVRVKISAEKTSVDLKDVKEVLSKAISKFEATLEILEDLSAARTNLPVARKARNAFNNRKTTLKVEFFYTRDPKGTSSRVYLEDSKVTVTAQLEGATQSMTRITDKGKANFGLVKPGKYKITVEYPESDECKYDWIDKTRDVVLNFGDQEIVEFEVEPLYQKVEFIAHCLLTIPNQIFVMKGDDAEKLTITTKSDGKREYTFKEKPDDPGLFNSGDLYPPLPPGVRIAVNKEGVETLTLGKRTIYWRKEELDMRVPNLSIIEFVNSTSDTNYEIKFKEGFSYENLDKTSIKNEMFEITFTGNLGDKNTKFYLTLKDKKNYWTLNDLDKSDLHLGKMKIGNLLPNSPNVYEVEFEKGFILPGSSSPEHSGSPPPPPVFNAPPPPVFNAPPPPPMFNAPPPPGMSGASPSKKATITQDSIDKTKGTLTLHVNPGKINKWTLNDINQSLDPRKITVNEQPNSDGTYEVKFNKRDPEFYEAKDLEGDWKAKYHGFVNDDDDIKARVKFVAETLEQAYKTAKKDPTILKIFMVPECFFQGLYGAYITDDAAKLVEMLQRLVKDERWQDWVFSFGTVNRVFESLPPQGMKHEKEIYEMANHAPVIRGGLGDSGYSGDGSTRLIQKLVNSAELADEGDLIRDERAKRRQAVNEEVQFEATENDEKAARFLEKLLKTDKEEGSPGHLFVGSKGLPDLLWRKSPGMLETEFHGLKEDLEHTIGKLGMARVIRQIRISANTKVNDKPLKDGRLARQMPVWIPFCLRLSKLRC